MRHRLLALVTGLVVVLLAPAAGKAGEAVWYLGFTHEGPQRISLGDEDTGDVDIYWYMIYRIRNNDQEAHKIFIDITAEGNKGGGYHDSYHPQVVEAVKRQIGEGQDAELWSQPDVTTPEAIPDKTPEVRPGQGFEEPVEIALPAIGAGEERRCVAVFHRMAPEMNLLTIRVRGLNNDVAIVRTADNERSVTEWVYEVVYTRPGDEFAPSLDAWEFVREGWTTVQTVIQTDLR